jgi:hypothetical protein
MNLVFARNSMGTLPLTGRAGEGCATSSMSGLPSPLPNPPRKGEGVRSSVGPDRAKVTARHLPLDGGGWERVRPTLRRQQACHRVAGAQ